jgi:molybdopterin-guanine dinucleotide biosynthesis protein A
MLDHVIEAVRPLVTEILVVAAPGSNPRLPQGATLVHDPVAFEGPLAGVLAGLGAARESIVLVVGGDMPALVGAVIESMLQALDALEEPEREAVVLEHDGRGRPLPLVLRREPALAAAQGLFTAGERRLRALPGALATATIPEPAWRTLDPEGQTLRDVDTEEDLPAR